MIFVVLFSRAQTLHYCSTTAPRTARHHSLASTSMMSGRKVTNDIVGQTIAARDAEHAEEAGAGDDRSYVLVLIDGHSHDVSSHLHSMLCY